MNLFLLRKQYILTGLVAFIGLMSFADKAQAASLNFGDLAVSVVAPTGAVTIDDYTTAGTLTNAIALPNSSTASTGIVSSYSNQFEGAVTESVNGQYLTYYGYQAPTTTATGSTPAAANTALSSSYTSGYHGTTATTGGTGATDYNRVVAEINIATGAVNTSTVLGDTNSGGDTRDSITVNGSQFYTVGNADVAAADNSASTIGVHYSTLGASTSVNLGSADTTGNGPSKYDNFNSVSIYNNTLYVSKGSGGTGSNGIFQVGTAGTLPTTAPATPSTNNITLLPGFPTNSTTYHPDGFFFANANTLYVSDQGGNTATAGLEKWLYNGTQWNLAYTIQSGLSLTTPPSGSTSDTVGIRNVTGEVNANGTVSLYAITAQSSSTDVTDLVGITDVLADTSLPTNQSFTTLAVSPSGGLFRGVTVLSNPVPEPSSILGSLGALGFGAFFVSRQLKSRKIVCL